MIASTAILKNNLENMFRNQRLAKKCLSLFYPRKHKKTEKMPEI